MVVQFYEKYYIVIINNPEAQGFFHVFSLEFYKI